MIVRVDAERTDSLGAHLTEEGFPATRVDEGELEVLFPGAPQIFAAAAQLDLWEARGGGCAAAIAIEL